MTSVQELQSGPAGAGLAGEIARMARTEGTGAHGYPRSDAFVRGRHATANLADAVHHLCVLYGRHPGFIDVAAERAQQSAAADWLEGAAIAFGRERTLLATLTAAAGPLPSTAGEAQSAAALLCQRHALETLAASDRVGCAPGAVAALLFDWSSIRTLLDAAADRLGVTAPVSILPNRDETAAALEMLATSPSCERALRFGAQQLLVQQRGLWDLLEARTGARTHG